MSKGKDSFRVNTKDAFAFLSIFHSLCSSPPKKEKERPRVNHSKTPLPLQPALYRSAVPLSSRQIASLSSRFLHDIWPIHQNLPYPLDFLKGMDAHEKRRPGSHSLRMRHRGSHFQRRKEDDRVLIACEEAAIRTIEPEAEKIWAPAWRGVGDCKGERRCLLMGIDFIYPEFEVVRNENRCFSAGHDLTGFLQVVTGGEATIISHRLA